MWKGRISENSPIENLEVGSTKKKKIDEAIMEKPFCSLIQRQVSFNGSQGGKLIMNTNMPPGVEIALI